MRRSLLTASNRKRSPIALVKENSLSITPKEHARTAVLILKERYFPSRFWSLWAGPRPADSVKEGRPGPQAVLYNPPTPTTSRNQHRCPSVNASARSQRTGQEADRRRRRRSRVAAVRTRVPHTHLHSQIHIFKINLVSFNKISLSLHFKEFSLFNHSHSIVKFPPLVRVLLR